MKYRPELDILRFCAFLMVLGCHALAAAPSSHHFYNYVVAVGSRVVDLFFALSAYLITEILMNKQRQRGQYQPAQLLRSPGPLLF